MSLHHGIHNKPHHHLGKPSCSEKVRNLYVTFWCQQGAEMSLVSNGSFQKITITTLNQSPIHKIIHQYILISFASKYPLDQFYPWSVDAGICKTPGDRAISMYQGRVSSARTIPIWLVSRKFYLVTPCLCDGASVTWVCWAHWYNILCSNL